MKRDLYAEVSTRIVAELEAGAAPWVKPWSATAGMNTPCNAVTNRPYSGCNVLLLWMAQTAGYRTPRFLIFKQTLELGGNVRKGEHGTKVYFVKQLQVHDKGSDDNSATLLVPMMREYTVFNVDQCENLPDSIYTGKPMRLRNPDMRDEFADAFLHSTGADIREGQGEAFYVPSRDFISMPAFDAFKGADHFYNVAFHELTHWAGHRSRLDRDLKNRAARSTSGYAMPGSRIRQRVSPSCGCTCGMRSRWNSTLSICWRTEATTLQWRTSSASSRF